MEGYDLDEFLTLDPSSLFRETDEMTTLKTLQRMRLAYADLEEQLKLLMVQENDSVLLYANNVLDVCNTLRNCEAKMDAIANLPNHNLLEIVKLNPLEEQFDDNELLRKNLFLDSTISSETIQQVKNKPKLVSKCILELQGSNLKNYKMLKRNKLLESYNFLKRLPKLIMVIEHLLPSLNLHQQDKTTFKLFISQHSKLVQVLFKRLETKCHSVLNFSSVVEHVLQAAGVLLLLGNLHDTIAKIKQERISRLNTAGKSQSLETILLDIFANVILEAFLDNIKDNDDPCQYINSTDQCTCEYGANDSFKQDKVFENACQLIYDKMQMYSVDEIPEAYSKLKQLVEDYPVSKGKVNFGLFDNLCINAQGLLHEVSKHLLQTIDKVYFNTATNLVESILLNIDKMLVNYKDPGKELEMLASFKSANVHHQQEFEKLILEKLSLTLVKVNTLLEVSFANAPLETVESVVKFDMLIFLQSLQEWIQSSCMHFLMFALEKFPKEVQDDCQRIQTSMVTYCLEKVLELYPPEQHELCHVNIIIAGKSLRMQFFTWNRFKHCQIMDIIDDVALQLVHKSISKELQGCRVKKIRHTRTLSKPLETNMAILSMAMQDGLYKNAKTCDELKRLIESVTVKKSETCSKMYQTFKHMLL
ncbi:hypothetical protein BdWA1_002795 [Babesia duncani]|uniref:Uncharacterized protein n=1 Tax=Babesia duncani TaxID=323732 RepID=A0AAD9UNY9_9APIC|nr:hypothetical protein BdWA1_002795 [Babesia duncani]